MRRYSSARNAIEQTRERWGLGDTEQSQSVPSGQGPSIGTHPLPLTGREAPAPYFRPLPNLPDRPLWNPSESAESGAVDYAARQRSQLDQVPKGSQVEPVTVYPAWESRLERMRDFCAPLRFAGYTPLVATPGSLLLGTYNVPQGYTAFWKTFRVFFDPLPGGLSPSNTLITLLVDGLIVPDYYNLPLGPFMASDQDTFVVAAEGRQLTIRIDVTAALGTIDTDATPPLALLYGNLRPRSGEPEASDVGVRPPPPLVIAPPAAAPTASAPPPRLAPPWSIEIARIASGAGSSGGGPRARLLVNENGRQRQPTAAELRDYADLFAAARASMPPTTRWI